MLLSKSPEQILAESHLWKLGSDAPKIIKKISGGFTNDNFLISISACQYVLRIHHPEPKKLGINREHEFLILKTLAPMGFVPEVFYWCADYSVLSFSPGRCWTDQDFQTPSQRNRLTALIAHYRQIELAIAPMDYPAYLNNYWQRFSQLNPQEARALEVEWHRFERALIRLQKTRGDCVLVHHDLNPSNIIEADDGLKIIDWEYAGMGWGELDELMLIQQSARFDVRSLKPNCESIYEEILWWLERLWWGLR